MAVPVPVQLASGDFASGAYAGNTYFAHSGNGAITWSVGLTQTTAVGLIVSNPAGSAVDLELIAAEFTPSSAVAGGVAVCIGPYSSTAVTHTTAITVRSAIGGVATGNSLALADTGATIPVAPVPARQLAAVISTSTTVVPAPSLLNINGSLIVPQGCSVSILATAAVTGWASLTWKEVKHGSTA